MKPTEQQNTCVALSKTEDVLKIIACAGAGKTSTLKLQAAANAVRSLYMAFNKVTAEEAKVGFPSHVVCQTTHSIAYRQFGVNLQHKLKRPTGKYVNVAGTPSEIARYYGIKAAVSPFSGDCLATASGMGLLIRQTVERFEQSADERVEDKHIPIQDAAELRKHLPHIMATITLTARKLWEDRIDADSVVMASHDTYLKLFQLSKPKLDYKIFYVDEAQDSTPCVLDIVKRQMDHAKIVMVGDPFQAIYGWRGAINALDQVVSKEALLSKSFRYGNGIADIASKVLMNKMKIEGRDDIVCKVGSNVVDRSQPYMYLFRTNSALIYEAVAALANGEDIKIEVDVRDFVRVLESANALFLGDMKNVKHDLILPYPEWETLEEEADEVKGELKRIRDIVVGGDVDRFIRVLSTYQAPATAKVVYTTAHKAKGRESKQVILAEDFPSNYNEGKWVGLATGEENLLYVAVTRAMQNLELNSTVYEIINHLKAEGYEDEPEYASTIIYTSGDLKGDMAIFAQEIGEREDNWRDERKAEGYTDEEIDNLPF